MPDPMICIHTGTTTWQGPQSEAPICRVCGGVMRPGIAMGQTLTGIPDFPGDDYAITLSPGGPGRIITCRKCARCGHSLAHAIGREDE